MRRYCAKDTTSGNRRTAFAATPSILISGVVPVEFSVSERERVLFIGTQFSILYTSMYSPCQIGLQGFGLQSPKRTLAFLAQTGGS
jgi:hypothetical protein